ncbi:MAG: DUF2934 domain-containing protein [Verrucomicrobiota bacterium]
MKSEPQWRLKTDNKQIQKDKRMATKAVANKCPSPSVQDAKNHKSTPSHELIEARAYEIWRAEGQPAGCEQKNWFRAEAQLQGA